MFRAIAEKIEFPKWCEARYKRLTVLEKWIRGEFYDHISIPFSTETTGDDHVIPMLDRRPSVQYNLPRSIAAETRRWLWAGRNRPRLVSENNKLLEACSKLLKESSLFDKISEATYFGSVGSAAVTFGITPGADGYPHVLFDTWRAKDCTPFFNDAGELRQLRVQYLCSGRSFMSQQVFHDFKGDPLDPSEQYWFTRDFDTQMVWTYRPIKVHDYIPVEPRDQVKLIPDYFRSSPHLLGFVPGEWIKNLPGGNHPDGDCTFEPALNTCVVLDYTLSQLPRGLWYNLSPLLVVEGEVAGEETSGVVMRAPTTVLRLTSVVKGPGGQAEGGGKAYLLESNGKVFEVASQVIDQYVKLAKEQIQASRKDPDKLTAPQSGVAIDSLEDEHKGLIQELRASYGERGFLGLLRKVSQACSLIGHPAFAGVSVSDEALEDIGLQWPREQMNGQEFSFLEEALADLMERKIIEPQQVADFAEAHLDLSKRQKPLPPDAGEKPPEPAPLEPKGSKSKSKGD